MKNGNFCKDSPVRKKIEQVCISKYGVANWTQSVNGKNVLSKAVTSQWKEIKNSLVALEPYSLEETVRVLKEGDYWKSLQGKAKNRTLLKNNPRLYKSVYTYTQDLEDRMKECGRYASSYNFSHRLAFLAERNADIESMRCSCGRTYSWTGLCRHCSEGKDTTAGLTEEQKQIRKDKIVYSARMYNCKKMKQEGLKPNYDVESIPVLIQISKDLKCNLRHAENGGEVDCMGYWLDGYDSEKNILVEIDEPFHFVRGKLLDRDIKRQSCLEKELGCKTYRYYFNKRTGSVKLYNSPENSTNWDYRKGLELSTEIGVKKNGTKTYRPYGT